MIKNVFKKGDKIIMSNASLYTTMFGRILFEFKYIIKQSFSLLPLGKLSLLILFASFFVSVLCLFFFSKVIALPTIAIVIVVALSHS